MLLRDLEFAMKTNDPESKEFKDDFLTDMYYLCSFGLKNDLREHVEESVSLIKYGSKKDAADPKKGDKNSVNIRLISGDHLETCISVAMQAGIINKAES